MRTINKTLFGLLIFGLVESVVGADPPACPDTSKSQYDYIVVGAGAGGGPLAARLALNGYSVLLLETGSDSYQNNVTIPFYFGRTTEDEKLALDYEVDHYTSPNNVTAWYPRSQGIGGSTIHNALIHMRAQDWDFDNVADITGDESWRASSMQKYLTRLEKNLYVPQQAGKQLNYGYDGWLSTNSAPLNLIRDPKYADEQIGSIMDTLIGSAPAIGGSDWNNLTTDGVEGSAMLTFTRDQYNNRSSVRDHLVEVRTRFPDKLTIQTETMATRILICKTSSGSLQAYGVEAASGSYLLPIARQFAGKRTLDLKTYTARYEVIVSAGTFQTPQLLMLSGIGPSQQLSRFGITTLVDLPGVGENVQDRMEATVVWKLNHTHKIFSLGCQFGDDPQTDPCLADWIATNHTNVYSLGAAFWGQKSKSSPNVSHLDVLSIWGPGAFTHYYRGFGRDYGMNSPNSINNAIMKAYARSKGWIRLTGSDPQDKLEINKNYLGSAESIDDLTILRDNIQKARRYVAATPQINQWVVQETWPGSQYQSDEQLWEFLRANVFGHHLCCSAKMGADNDTMAVLNSQFQVRGVENLRVVDASVFPVIPGMFVTTPIYTISEKAADSIIDTAKANGWGPGTGTSAATTNSNSGISIKGAVSFTAVTLVGLARIPSPSTSPCPTPPPQSQVLSGITIHIIDAKLDPNEVVEMRSLAQSTGAKLSRTAQHASVLITTLTMKRRLERHVSWDVANTKHIVSPQWLRACVAQNKMLPFSQFQTIKTAAVDRRVSLNRPAADATQDSTPAGTSQSDTLDSNNYEHPLSTHRRSPLICPNQALCLELATLMKARFLEGESNSELSYSRAIATLKAYPKEIKDAGEVRKLPHIGPKIQKLIEGYLKTGKIAEAQKAATSERFKVLSLLTQVHGVGATKAREHYAAGHKTLQDLTKFYEAKAEAGTHLGVFAALQLHDELNTAIPREEVETIAKDVYKELSAIQPGCEYTICGVYRRGKPYTNDVDIIFTHQQTGLERHLCAKFVDHLKEIGMVKHVLNHSEYTSNHEGTHGHQNRSRACMDVLDKALVILKPKDSLHRRVDLIFAPYSVYWTAIVGWTGSKQFERDLRIHAKQQGLKFDSGGITRLRDSKLIVAYSEEEVFSKLGLKYVEPEFRNADV